MDAVVLRAPYLDTDAAQLCFSLDLPERPALAERLVELAGLDVRLRLLGASHQVFAGPVRETVACLPGARRGLPAAHRLHADGWSYDFGAETRQLTPGDFAAQAARIRETAARTDTGLCGIFPGSPDALTAVVAEAPGGVLGWRTWHTYPQSCQIVSTYTRLEAR
ncbi:DUF2617 family protein [Streptomyces polyrhachis]|uniref:DUF2617 family protein n=1 Tax=Streptomyces polyrhachis TaxID=1282885 RepID=A0ABW2GHS5_9ACTN